MIIVIIVMMDDNNNNNNHHHNDNNNNNTHTDILIPFRRLGYMNAETDAVAKMMQHQDPSRGRSRGMIPLIMVTLKRPMLNLIAIL